MFQNDNIKLRKMNQLLNNYNQNKFLKYSNNDIKY